MMTLEQRISAFSLLSSFLDNKVKTEQTAPGEIVFAKAAHLNPWFIHQNVLYAMSSLSEMLKEDKLYAWLDKYDQPRLSATQTKSIGVVNAGNIPLVGFHDFLCILISGNKYI